jgi:hypothetical protein
VIILSAGARNPPESGVTRFDSSVFGDRRLNFFRRVVMRVTNYSKTWGYNSIHSLRSIGDVRFTRAAKATIVA